MSQETRLAYADACPRRLAEVAAVTTLTPCPSNRAAIEAVRLAYEGTAG